jgi:hypothetical protein
MLDLPQIDKVLKEVAPKYKVKNISIFGSYADGTAVDTSDLDLLVEFFAPDVSLLTLIDLKYSIEDRLNINVDVIHAPIDKDALIKPQKVVKVYGQ